MKLQALQFAHDYQNSIEQRSEYAEGKPRHPVLYAFVGDCADAYAYLHTKGAFSVYIAETNADDIPRAIRMVKADIQRNEQRLNIKRINIFIITQASNPQPDFINTAGTLLREIFVEDFPIVHMSLFVLLSESNHWEDYEHRAALSYQTLRAITNNQHENPVYNRVFLLSDRNEHDVVSDENMRNNYKLINRLHDIDYTESHFEDSLQKKSIESGTPYFMTAGIARLEKPTEAIAYAVFCHVYEYLLATLKEGGFTFSADALLTQLIRPEAPMVIDRQIINGIQSVAARDVSAGELRGKNVKEAEAILFGNGVTLFFEMNYGQRTFFNIEEAPNILRQYLSQQAIGLIALSAYRENAPDEDFRMLEAQIEANKHDIEHIYQKSIPNSLFFLKIDTVKRMIADAYIIRYKTERLLATHAALSAVYDGIREQAGYARRLLKKMEAEYVSLTHDQASHNHVSVYYKRVVDGILSELALRYGQGFLLQDAFIGPYTGYTKTPTDADHDPDLSLLTEKIGAFIHKHIFTHEALRLTFDEDLLQRSQVSPTQYDGEFTHADEFYRRVVSDAEQQAALPVSLQRYDDLIREKYYFGDTEGVLMRYIRQRNSDYNGEAAYYLPEASGFTVIRLAGGFTLENLTRYPVMVKCYDHIRNTTGECI